MIILDTRGRSPKSCEAHTGRGDQNDNISGELPVWRGRVRGRGTIRSLPELPLLALPESNRDGAFVRGDRQSPSVSMAAGRSVRRAFRPAAGPKLRDGVLQDV